MKKYLLGLMAAAVVAAPLTLVAAPAQAAATYTTGAPTTVVSKPTATSVKVTVKANGSRVVSKATTIYKGATVIARQATASGLKTGNYKTKTVVRYRQTIRRTSDKTLVRVLPKIKSVTRWNSFGITAPCMTYAEWSKIQDGMSRSRVTQIVGFSGYVGSRSESSDGSLTAEVYYRQCLPDGQRAPKYSTSTYRYQEIVVGYDTFDWDAWYDTGVLHVDMKDSWSRASR